MKDYKKEAKPSETTKGVFDSTTLKKLKFKNRVFLGPCIHTAPKIEKIVENDVSMVTT